MAEIKPTEARYKGGAREMYVTYDLVQDTAGENTATFPRVKRVYIAGDVDDWDAGRFQKRSGRRVHGVRIHYSQDRAGYDARRGGTRYHVEPTRTRFTRIVEVPDRADHVQFRGTELPQRYRSALQDVS